MVRSLAPAQLLTVATALLCAATYAQTPPSNGPAEPAYQDRLIDGGALPLEIWDQYAPLQSADGWPRSLRLDALWASTRRNDVSTTQAGIGVSGFLATPQYGAFSLDGLFTDGDDRSIASLWQRDMPFEGGWRISNGLGMLNTPAIDLVRLQPRIFLATTPMFGGVTEWRGPGADQLTAGYGEPGAYIGAYIPEFRRLGGRLRNVGAQFGPRPGWSFGSQFVAADNVTNTFQPQDAAPPIDARSALFAVAKQDPSSRFQLNVLNTNRRGSDAEQGIWFDGVVQSGRLSQSFGVFYLEPSLLWGNQPVVNDAEGGYYRAVYSSPRWLWDAGLDYVAPVDDEGREPVTFLNGSVRYRLSRDLSAGTGANLRLADDSAWRGFGFIEHVTALMTGRLQLDRAEDDARRETVFSYNQTWNTRAGTRLNTTVSAGRFRSDRTNSWNQVALAAYGGGDIARNVSLDLNVQWNRSFNDADPSSTTGSVVLTWSILPELHLIATAYSSQAKSRTPLAVVSPLDPLLTAADTRVDDTGAFIILRWERRAGSLGAPLGGLVGAGAGRVAGMVFLDGNDSDRFEAGEQGVANVTVLLDGRFSVRTDAQGRFEFPSVSAGRHVLTVLSDNVPLPWLVTNDGRTEIEVPVRGNTTVDIAAQRPR